MTDLSRLLRDGDPVVGELFPAAEVDGMLGRLRLEAERGVLVTEREQVPWGTAWRVMVTALTCVAIVAMTAIARRALPAHGAAVAGRGPDRMHVQRIDRSAASVVPVRHLQFSTPEGIRVFWTFDPNFQESRR